MAATLAPVRVSSPAPTPRTGGYTTTGYTTSRPSSPTKNRSDDSRSTVSTSSGGGGTDLSLSSLQDDTTPTRQTQTALRRSTAPLNETSKQRSICPQSMQRFPPSYLAEG
ncbi:hypothetical protein CY34DRAFT_16024 [Suillus luteus UH-Slu-Lm8-n1]|uniref:Uncharacterized protein n=1 Tax=Suillus luteus UH-Slu-Lm8-n1 TaxID=930992 RepID=A0A0D0AFP7_9AGAM|nr:hypothetical protein CY34DRAFT_16024 [Suillus luteus UH-Slu-Lm8-n1]